jgi:hypothetical protein
MSEIVSKEEKKSIYKKIEAAIAYLKGLDERESAVILYENAKNFLV